MGPAAAGRMDQGSAALKFKIETKRMIPVLLILIPIVSGCISFFLKNGNNARAWALLSSIITCIVAVSGLLYFTSSAQWSADVEWIPSLGTRFAVGGDGLGKLLTLL